MPPGSGWAACGVDSAVFWPPVLVVSSWGSRGLAPAWVVSGWGSRGLAPAWVVSGWGSRSLASARLPAGPVAACEEAAAAGVADCGVDVAAGPVARGNVWEADDARGIGVVCRFLLELPTSGRDVVDVCRCMSMSSRDRA